MDLKERRAGLRHPWEQARARFFEEGRLSRAVAARGVEAPGLSWWTLARARVTEDVVVVVRCARPRRCARRSPSRFCRSRASRPIWAAGGRAGIERRRMIEQKAPVHYAGHDLEALADLKNYSNAVIDGFAPHLRGRVVEVGAGIGNFAARFRPLVDEAVLVEPAVNLFDRLAERFAGDDAVRAVRGVVEEVPLEGGTFDAAVMVNVLEHIEDDGATLRRLRDLLRPGGALLLFVPAMPGLYGSLDREMGHHRRYTRGGLRDVVGAAGFAIDKLCWFDSLGVVPWFVVGRVLKATRIDARAAFIYDRVVVPGLSSVERRVHPPFGKNLLCVGRKPS